MPRVALAEVASTSGSAPAGRLRLGPLENPVRGLLHGSASLAAAGLAVYLFAFADGSQAGRRVLLVCALSHFALYLTSSLYHCLPWGPRAKARMQRLDHSMIYLGIAGLLTPIVWLGMDDWRGGVLLGAAWGIALAGSLQKLCFPRLPEKASIPVQVLEACLVLPALLPFAERYPAPALGLVGIGAGFYLAGALCFVAERPRLWPRVFSFHELFHLCTLAGSAAFFVLLVRYLARGA